MGVARIRSLTVGVDSFVVWTFGPLSKFYYHYIPVIMSCQAEPYYNWVFVASHACLSRFLLGGWVAGTMNFFSPSGDLQVLYLQLTKQSLCDCKHLHFMIVVYLLVLGWQWVPPVLSFFTTTTWFFLWQRLFWTGIKCLYIICDSRWLLWYGNVIVPTSIL